MVNLKCSFYYCTEHTCKNMNKAWCHASVRGANKSLKHSKAQEQIMLLTMQSQSNWSNNYSVQVNMWFSKGIRHGVCCWGFHYEDWARPLKQMEAEKQLWKWNSASEVVRSSGGVELESFWPASSAPLLSLSELPPARLHAHTHMFSSAVSLHCAGDLPEISTDLALLCLALFLRKCASAKLLKRNLIGPKYSPPMNMIRAFSL